MKYQDNEVIFSLTGDYSIISGFYIVNDFSITSGQDPDGNITSGEKFSFGNDGKMNFRIGRKLSESVADWFNGKISDSQNTFNHEADELNFAFLGTLEMTLTGGVMGGGKETFTFSNVALAQGKSGATNNWWFGGQDCSYTKDNQVDGKGTNPNGAEFVFTFRRGSNDVNEVEVTPTIIDTAHWMNNIKDSVRLDQIMMPGSHDAGMSELHHCAPPIGVEGYTKTQGDSISQQLVDGSRYFDIRVDYDYDTLVTYHRTDQWGCNGQDLKTVLNQVQQFLQTTPTETAIFKFSHIRDYNGHDPEFTKQKIDTLLNGYSTFIYKNPKENINLAEVTLGEVRGKMILVFDYSEYIDPQNGRFRYMDGSTIQPKANITVYDVYSDTSDYDTMKKDQLEKWQNYSGLDTRHFFLLSWTLTPTFGSPNVKNLAKEANDQLPDVLYDQIISNQADKPNIVYIDFMNSDTAQSIISYNFI